ncbi:hypothetical protein EI171_34360 [Bradyrhizobium sp. LCT2]|uniref:hypothetical protein n=1 Tax=Bradyrhizobium sp. LCT2 TaxID=2493093 RepID=UPI001373AAAD|nr:hypothetical protein [Bradyrhizobium sp. LCT2]QHP71933.1 hypothetical protein EI171_34360 [Bradyrhizobium sp. LCT2]
MNLNELADRYVAVWNERDSEKRKRQVAELWIPQGEHYIESHNEFVRDAGNRFRAVPGARREGNVVAFYWEMLPANADTVLGKGLEFVVVSDAGKIVQDYQFYPA